MGSTQKNSVALKTKQTPPPLSLSLLFVWVNTDGNTSGRSDLEFWVYITTCISMHAFNLSTYLHTSASPLLAIHRYVHRKFYSVYTWWQAHTQIPEYWRHTLYSLSLSLEEILKLENLFYMINSSADKSKQAFVIPRKDIALYMFYMSWKAFYPNVVANSITSGPEDTAAMWPRNKWLSMPPHL